MQSGYAALRGGCFHGLGRVDDMARFAGLSEALTKWQEQRNALTVAPLRDEERAFWRAIAENPDDDMPRLVYADWLGERGHQAECGEYIRDAIAKKPGALDYPAPPQAMADKVVSALGLELRGSTTNCPLEREAGLTIQSAYWFWERGFPSAISLPYRYLPTSFGAAKRATAASSRTSYPSSRCAAAPTTTPTW
jgi:uncharacterized protein (TIGR02996 family)